MMLAAILKGSAQCKRSDRTDPRRLLTFLLYRLGHTRKVILPSQGARCCVEATAAMRAHARLVHDS
jgi:hypothetical protein